MEWQLFKAAVSLSAAREFVWKRHGVVNNGKNVTPWWNQEIKDAIQAKKVAWNAWLQKKGDSYLCSRYAERRKCGALTVKTSKTQCLENIGHKLDSNYDTGKSAKRSDKPPGVFAAKYLTTLDLTKTIIVSYIAIRWTFMVDQIERVFQSIFKPRHYHVTGHAPGTFSAGKYHHRSWRLPSR